MKFEIFFLLLLLSLLHEKLQTLPHVNLSKDYGREKVYRKSAHGTLILRRMTRLTRETLKNA